MASADDTNSRWIRLRRVSRNQTSSSCLTSDDRGSPNSTAERDGANFELVDCRLLKPCSVGSSYYPPAFSCARNSSSIFARLGSHYAIRSYPFFKQLIMCWCRALQAGCARWPHEWAVSERGGIRVKEVKRKVLQLDMIDLARTRRPPSPADPSRVCLPCRLRLPPAVLLPRFRFPRFIAGGLPAPLSPPDGSSARLPSAADSLSRPPAPPPPYG